MNIESKKEFREGLKVDLSYPFDAEEMLLNAEFNKEEGCTK